MTTDPSKSRNPSSPSPARPHRERRHSIAPDAPVERRAELYTAGAVGVVAFFLYLMTMAPGLHFGDGPQLAAAAHALGVPHPTGYPLYMITLKLWLLLTVAGEVIVRTTLLNALISAFTAGLGTLVLLDLLRSALPRWTDKPRLIAAGCGALAAALLRFHWSNAVVTEVYALQFLLMLAFVRCIQRFTAAPGTRSLVWAAVFLGLGLAHHRMSIFLILPLVIVWILAVRRRALPSFGRPALLSVLAIAAGLSLYAYLPIRAAANPGINWGDPSTPGRFMSHVRGGEFVDQRFLRPIPTNPDVRFTAQTWTTFAAWETGQILSDFAGQILPLPENHQVFPMMNRVFVQPARSAVFVLIPLLALVGFGAWRLGRTAPVVFGVAALIAVQNLALLYLYNILDIRDYYLFPFWLGWVCAFTGVLVGIDQLLARSAVLANRTGLVTPPAWAIYSLLLAPLGIAAANWSRVDRSRDDGAEVMAALILPDSAELMPEGSVLLTGGDHDIFPAWYKQIARGERTDVLVVGSNFLRSPWYRKQFTPQQVERYHLRFSGAIPVGVEGFVQQLADDVIDANLRERPVFVTTLLDGPALQALDSRYRLVPVADAPVSGLGDYEAQTTVALVRIYPKEPNT